MGGAIERPSFADDLDPVRGIVVVIGLRGMVDATAHRQGDAGRQRYTLFVAKQITAPRTATSTRIGVQTGATEAHPADFMAEIMADLTTPI